MAYQVGGEGGVPPRDFWLGNFCWPNGKKEARKKGKRSENWETKKENWNCKRDGGKLKLQGGKVTKWGEALFFFVLFFAFHFSKPLKFVLGVSKWKFSTGKKAFLARKNIRKNFPVTPLPRCLCCKMELGSLTVEGALDKCITSFPRLFPKKLRFLYH